LNWNGTVYDTVWFVDPAQGRFAGYNAGPVKVVHPSIVAANLDDTSSGGLLTLNPPAGVAIYGAGTVSVQQGRILAIDNCSGHFKPDDQSLAYVVSTLSLQGVNTSTARVTVHNNGCRTYQFPPYVVAQN
jgi:hypothetical protein